MNVLLVLGIVMVALFGLTHALDQSRQQSVRRRMDGVLTRRGQNALDELGLIVRENQLVLRSYHGGAQRFRARGQHVDAAERMALGCRAIEALAPDFVTALAALRCLARTVSAIVSVEPVRHRSLRRTELRSLAALGEMLHELALSGRQQILLRLHVVGAVFRVALHQLTRSGGHVVAQPEDARAWARVEALVADLGTAGDEAVVAARQIVQALDAVELGYAVERNVHL